MVPCNPRELKKPPISVHPENLFQLLIAWIHCLELSITKKELPQIWLRIAAYYQCMKTQQDGVRKTIKGV
jgi:hypothetical protein